MAEGLEIVEAAPVRRLPAPAGRRELEPRLGEVRAAALVAAGGAVAGVATVAAVRAVRGSRRGRLSRRARRKQEPARVLASRSFLVDVHLLGR